LELTTPLELAATLKLAAAVELLASEADAADAIGGLLLQVRGLTGHNGDLSNADTVEGVAVAPGLLLPLELPTALELASAALELPTTLELPTATEAPLELTSATESTLELTSATESTLELTSATLELASTEST